MQVKGLTGARLSRQQTRLWSIQGESNVYRVQCAACLQGHLAMREWQRALHQVVETHEILHTTFRNMPGMDMPVQVIGTSPDNLCPLLDLSAIEVGRQEDLCQQLYTLLQSAALDPIQGPLYRLFLVRFSPVEHQMLLSLSAYLADPTTLLLFISETCTRYETQMKETVLDEEEPLQYIDVTAWQEEMLASEHAQEAREFWSKHAFLERATSLPFQQTVTGTVRSNNFAPAVLKLAVDATLSSQLRSLAQYYQVPIAVLLLTYWQSVLGRMAGLSETMIGVLSDGRYYSELKNMPGLYAGVVPCLISIDSRLSFEQALASVHRSMDEVYERQAYFIWPQEEKPAFLPLAFECLSWPTSLSAAGLTVALEQHSGCIEPFILKFSALEAHDRLLLELHYDPEYITLVQAQRIALAAQTLFASSIEKVEKTRNFLLRELEIVPEEEKERVLAWGRSAQVPGEEESFVEMFEGQVSQHGRRAAVRDAQGWLSYEQLNGRANQLARWLEEQGVEMGERVGVCLPKGVRVVEALLGILKAGGVYVPLEPGGPVERQRRQLRKSGVKLVLVEEAARRWGEGEWREVEWERWEEERGRYGQENGEKRALGEGLAYVMYTSGTSGEPKGVQIGQRNLLCYTRGIVQELRKAGAEPGWEYGLVTTMAADLGMTMLVGALGSGGCVQLIEGQQLLSGRQWEQWMQEHPVEVLKTVPSHLGGMLQGCEGKGGLPRKVLVLGGEGLGQGLRKEIEGRGGECVVYNHYGPTETSVGVLLHGVGEGEGEEGLVVLGRPFGGAEVYVLDERGELVGEGVEGEVYVGGGGVGWGYEGEAGQTAQRYVPHGYSRRGGERLYRTGDRGWWTREGEVQYGGRVDGQVKVRGYRVEVGEIEEVVKRHEGVWDAAVVVQEGTAKGEPRLVGYIVKREQQTELNSQMLRAFIQKYLPEYMVPATFVYLKTLPLTANGKLDRARLPKAEEQVQDEPALYVPPSSPIEEIITEIWRGVLGVTSFSTRDNFFHLGGHSLLATQVIARIQGVLQVELSIADLFEAPTVTEQALLIERALHNEQPPLIPVDRTSHTEIPLSFAQQRLWFLDQLEPGNTAYLLPRVLHFHGALNSAWLEQALEEMIRRHEILRTTFVVRTHYPVQIIHPAVQFHLPVIDLHALPEPERNLEVQRLRKQEASYPCDLSRGPLLRPYLLVLDAQERILFLTMHHIITDAWSYTIFINEVSALYHAFSSGQASPLPPLSIQYADFALWQRQWLQGERLEQQLSYWKRQLVGSEPLELFLDHPRSSVQTYRGSSCSALIPPALQKQLIRLSQQENVTLFMLLLAAFQVLLARYSGQTDISIGTPIANRTHVDLENVIGFFVNTLVLRTDLAGNPSFVALLRRVREVALGAYSHQDIPFEQLVEELQPQRNLSISPLFQVMFSVAQYKEREERGISQEEPQASSLRMKADSESGEFAMKFDLEFNLVSNERGLLCDLSYNSDLFEQSTIARMLEHFRILLEDIVVSPERSIAHLALLTPGERHRLLVEWNQTQRNYPLQASLSDLFAAQATEIADRIAVGDEQVQLSYAALDRRATLLGRSLRALGTQEEVPVGVYMPRSVDLLVALLAIAKAGGVYIPLDPAYPVSHLSFILADANIQIVLTQGAESFQPTVKIPHLLDLKDVLQADLEMLPVEGQSPWLAGQQLAYVIYTSGSTGKPKGAMVTLQGMCNHLWAKIEDLDLGSEDIIAQTASHCFDISIWQMLAALLVGGRVHILPDEITHDPQQLFWYVEARAISILEIVPSLLNAFLQSSSTAVALSNLRWLGVTGEQCAGELCRSWLRRYPQIPLLNAYGPTECSDDVTHALLNTQMQGQRASAPIGRAIANTRLYVLDRQMEPVPSGVPAELYVGGTGVGRGYLGDAVQTAQSFLPDPFGGQPGQRLYRTGDIGRYQADGQLEFLRRIDQQVKVRGYRIELGEIEARLSAHPGVHECVVIVREDVPDDPQLVAYAVANSAATDLSEAELRAYLRTALPAYMLPGAIVILASMPLTRNGKIDRRALPAPGELASEQESEHEFFNPIEELVRDLWCEILGRDSLSREASFFELGGHSLLATQLVSRLSATLGVELAVRSLFEEPTFHGWALRVEQALRENQGVITPPLLPAPRPRDIPLSFAQQRLWFLDRLEPGNTAYLIRSALRLRGHVLVEVLERSFMALLQRHESLRTAFQLRGDQPVQVIHEAATFSLPVVDLSALAEDARSAQVQLLQRQEGRQPFDLRQAPLVRVYLLRQKEDEHALVITLHHIISDGWSDDIFHRELAAFYAAFATGKLAQLPPLPVQYADFALWQRQWLQGEALESQLSYWRRQLSGLVPLKLPVDHPRPATQSYRGAVHHFALSADLVEVVRRLSQQEGATPFMVLLMIFQILLHQYCRQDDIAVGSDLANRNKLEIEGLIGFFINQLILRTSLAGNPTCRNLLRQVRAMTLDAYLHQDLPFEKLVEVLQPERSLQAAPLFQAKMIFQHIAPVRTGDGEGAHAALAVSDVSLTGETTQLDLILRIFQTPQGFSGAFTYCTDLFEPGTIERMAQHFLTLLASVGANPDARISELDVLAKEEKEQKHMEQKKIADTALAKFKSIKPQRITVQQESLVQTAPLFADQPLPLAVQPRQAELDLVEWAENNLPWIESTLLKYGALLFRGFSLTTPAVFERFAMKLCSDIFSENGEHVPVEGVGSGNLYTPVFYAPEKKLLWHNENSFNESWPMKILFHCSRPAAEGGETPIADSRKVYSLLDSQIREEFLRKDIMYVRNYGEGLGLDWQTVFRTREKAAVEAYCRQAEIEFSWKGPDHLLTRQVRPAIVKHPQTGEFVWWNQATHWHSACLDPEVRASLRTLFSEEDQPRNCYYGDGSPIDDSVIEAICDAYQAAEISFPWQVGDILLLDNMLVAHARNPYKGPRKIYVAMGGMITMHNPSLGWRGAEDHSF